MAAAASKRKAQEATSENSQNDKVARTDDVQFFSGLTFTLHPAALSRTRKAIFHKQIEAKGGMLVDNVRDGGGEGERLVLIEDTILADEEKQKNIANKIRSCGRTVCVLGLSWVSKCLEANQLVNRQPFEIAPIAVSTKDKNEQEPPPQSLVSDPSSSRQSFVERNKHKFVCAQSSDSPRVGVDNPNKVITDQLERLAAAYKASNDTWRAFSYQKAASAIKNYGEKITKREDLEGMRGVGQKMADKVMEILEEGKLEKAEEICDSEKVR